MDINDFSENTEGKHKKIKKKTTRKAKTSTYYFTNYESNMNGEHAKQVLRTELCLGRRTNRKQKKLLKVQRNLRFGRFFKT